MQMGMVNTRQTRQIHQNQNQHNRLQVHCEVVQHHGDYHARRGDAGGRGYRAGDPADGRCDLDPR